MVLSKKQQKKLWKEEAGEFICIKDGLKHLLGGWRWKVGGGPFLQFNNRFTVYIFKYRMKKALEKFKTAKLLDEKLRKDLIFDTGYRYSSHSLEKLPQVFVKNINTIIDFLEKVKDSHKWNMEKAGYILGWQLDESPDSDKKGKPPNNTTVLGRDNVPRYTIERKEYIGTVELTQKLEKLFVDVFIQRKKRLKK